MRPETRSTASSIGKISPTAKVKLLLGSERARMKHLLGFELTRRHALAVAILKKLVDLRTRLFKTPKVDVGTGDCLFFLPQSAVPERCLMHALPFEPLVAFLFRLLPGVIHAHRNPGIFLQYRSFD